MQTRGDSLPVLPVSGSRGCWLMANRMWGGRKHPDACYVCCLLDWRWPGALTRLQAERLWRQPRRSFKSQKILKSAVFQAFCFEMLQLLYPRGQNVLVKLSSQYEHFLFSHILCSVSSIQSCVLYKTLQQASPTHGTLTCLKCSC